MYCDKCGNKISEGEKFCSKCGAQLIKNNEVGKEAQLLKNGNSTESATAFFCIGSVLTMLISGFLKLYKIDCLDDYNFHFDYSFTPFEFSKFLQKLTNLLNFEDEPKATLFFVGISYFYYVMFALASILAIVCLKNINDTNGKIGIKYYKDIKSSLLFSLCGNIGLLFLLKIVNMALKEELTKYQLSQLEISVFGGTATFFITMIIGIAGFVLATSGIKKCKNDIEQGTVEKYVAKLKELKNKK